VDRPFPSQSSRHLSLFHTFSQWHFSHQSRKNSLTLRLPRMNSHERPPLARGAPPPSNSAQILSGHSASPLPVSNTPDCPSSQGCRERHHINASCLESERTAGRRDRYSTRSQSRGRSIWRSLAGVDPPIRGPLNLRMLSGAAEGVPVLAALAGPSMAAKAIASNRRRAGSDFATDCAITASSGLGFSEAS